MKFSEKQNKNKIATSNRSINEMKGNTDLNEESFAKKTVRVAIAIRENSHLVLCC